MPKVESGPKEDLKIKKECFSIGKEWTTVEFRQYHTKAKLSDTKMFPALKCSVLKCSCILVLNNIVMPYTFFDVF